jgi:hypothetical protein
MRDGAVIAKAVVLSHAEQYSRLAESTPNALPAAVVAGDPCYDRIRASMPRRARYRDALGATEDTTVVVVSSTWGDESLFGRYPDLLSEVLAELPIDEHIVAGILHPNTWFGHGPWQIRCWLGDCLRAGLRLVPPAQGWQQAIIAADVVIGDHGAVTGYSASIGTPTLLATFPNDDVVPGSAIWELGKTAPRLNVSAPLRAQLDHALGNFDPMRFAGVTDLTSSVPQQSAQLLRRTFYQLMNLSEPDRAALLPQFSVAGLVPEHLPVTATWVAGELIGPNEIRLTRWPADVSGRRGRVPDGVDVHLVVGSDHPRPTLADNAAILIRETVSRAGQPDHDMADVLHVRPSGVLAVARHGQRGVLVQHRTDGTVHATLDGDDIDPVTSVSAIYILLVGGCPWRSLPDRYSVVVGGHRARVRIDHLDAGQ